MKIKNIKKIFRMIIIFILCILFIAQVQVLAFDTSYYEPSSLSQTTGTEVLENRANKIIGVIQVIGSIASVAALIIMGIKYVLGSVEEKAEYKKTMRPYIIGVVIFFGLTNFLSIIQSIVLSF